MKVVRTAVTIFGGALILVMSFLVGIDVVGRKFFHFSTLVSDEYSGYMLAILTLLGLSYTTSQEGHVRMEALFNLFPNKTKQVVMMVCYFLGILYGAILTWVLVKLCISSWIGHSLAATPARTPIAIPQVFLPIGTGLMVIEMAIRMAQTFKAYLGTRFNRTAT